MRLCAEATSAGSHAGSPCGIEGSSSDAHKKAIHRTAPRTGAAGTISSIADSCTSPRVASRGWKRRSMRLTRRSGAETATRRYSRKS